MASFIPTLRNPRKPAESHPTINLALIVSQSIQQLGHLPIHKYCNTITTRIGILPPLPFSTTPSTVPRHTTHDAPFPLFRTPLFTPFLFPTSNSSHQQLPSPSQAPTSELPPYNLPDDAAMCGISAVQRAESASLEPTRHCTVRSRYHRWVAIFNPVLYHQRPRRGNLRDCQDIDHHRNQV